MLISKNTADALRYGKLDMKVLAGNYYSKMEITVESGRLFFNFPYNEILLGYVKNEFEGRKWHGFIEGDKRKVWSAPITQRNLFRLEVLQGKYGSNPYKYWSNDTPRLDEIARYCNGRTFDPYQHQAEMIQLSLNSRWDMLGAEMGTGKTLSALIAIEMACVEHGWDLDPEKFLWVGPKSALVAVEGEFEKWKIDLRPKFSTYAGLKKLVETWPAGVPAPLVVVFDEASRLKGEKSQRSQAAKHITDSMRAEHMRNCYILELSGTPAPKAPTDWWMPIEVVCPGFVSENNIHSFKQRLAHMITEESIPGVGAFQKLKSWRDSTDKCKYCGEEEEHVNHFDGLAAEILVEQATHEAHAFTPGINEVENLSNRLEGCVGVWYKNDCLDLPEKQYHLYEVQPSTSLLNAAKMVVNNTPRAADALIKLRTLSDGFLYEKVGTGEFVPCEGCNGSGKVQEYYEESNPYDILLPEEITLGFRYVYDECPPDEDPITFIPSITGKRPVSFKQRTVDCHTCEGKGQIEKEERIVKAIPCPKIDIFHDLLEMHEESGRFVTYAGFTGSINRLVEESLKAGWVTVKADGKGWETRHPSDGLLSYTRNEAVNVHFQKLDKLHDKMVFIGQPGAAGMGLTLHASQGCFYYSNDYKPESRFQSEDRVHRLGMGERGGHIYDVVHLPSDQKVLDSLQQSKCLQRMSMDCLRSYYK